MDTSRVSDFSIERILSKPQVDVSLDRYIPEIPCGFMEPGNLRPPAPVPVPLPLPVPVQVLGCLQYRGVGFGNSFYAYGTAFHHPDFSGPHPNCGVCGSFRPEAADVRLFTDHQAARGSVLSRQRPRMRTVFTDNQTKLLEALFEVTDYPAMEARAELASNTGLNEETVRVWFKNRRARRKRQRSSSRGKSPALHHSPPCKKRSSSPPSSEPGR